MVKIRFSPSRSGNNSINSINNNNHSQKGKRPKSSNTSDTTSTTRDNHDDRSTMSSPFHSPVPGTTPLRTLSTNTSSLSLSSSSVNSNPNHSRAKAATTVKEEIDSNVTMLTSLTPKKGKATTTTRKVLDFFDCPRRNIFARTPKKKSRRLHHHQQQQQQQQQQYCADTPNEISVLIITDAPDDQSRTSTTETDTDSGANNIIAPNVLTWLNDEAPNDIVPKILSYAGIHRVHALSLTNKSWRRTCDSEAVWRTLCEDTHKWVEGMDPEPFCPDDTDDTDDAMDLDGCDDTNDRCTFWKRYYHDNPIVPLDYPTVAAALEGNSNKTQVPGWDPQTTIALHTLVSRSVRIFVVPGLYVVKDRLMVDTEGDFSLTIETLDDSRRCSPTQQSKAKSSAGAWGVSSPSLSSIMRAEYPEDTRRTTPTIRDRLSCCSNSSNSPNPVEHLSSPTHHLTQATIILKCRKKNEPVFHIRQGTLHLTKISVVHCCPGLDIWDGNAAIQIQPPIQDERPLPSLHPNRLPSAIITHSDIVSLSGRGVVAIDGGFATVRRSHVHHCAATGIYVGGPGSSATIETSDIVRNGNGNERNRRGIARGHSGVYLEQGVAVMTDCNVSNNALTGISAVSRQNAFLTVTGSDLVGNGSLQLELPPNGSESRRRSVWRDNVVETLGEGRYRSGLVPLADAPADTDAGGVARAAVAHVAAGEDGNGVDRLNAMVS